MLKAVLPEYSFDDLKQSIKDNNVQQMRKILSQNKNLINQAPGFVRYYNSVIIKYAPQCMYYSLARLL